LELYLLKGEMVDRTSPIFVRPQAEKQDLFDVTFLHSNQLDIRPRATVAFRMRIAPLDEEMIRGASLDDPTANYVVGQFILWELDDPIGARPYLESAFAGGIFDAIFDLAIVALFQATK